MVMDSRAMSQGNGIVKIAVTTNDGMMVAGHFGMAEFYQVVSTQAGKITSQEQRPKPHHMIHPDLEQAKGHDHQDMLAPIRDCQVLVCGGMRARAFEHAEAAGLKVVLAVGKIEDVVLQYLSGTLVSEPRRIRSQ